MEDWWLPWFPWLISPNAPLEQAYLWYKIGWLAREGWQKIDGGLMIALISLIDFPKCSPGTGLFMIQNRVAGQRRLAIPAPIPAPASPHQHGGQISTLPYCQHSQAQSRSTWSYTHTILASHTNAPSWCHQHAILTYAPSWCSNSSSWRTFNAPSWRSNTSSWRTHHPGVPTRMSRPLQP